MNFLDPDEWSDLVALEQEYEELTEELVKQLHERLRPYFLRRLKSQVLTLPPKVCSILATDTLINQFDAERSYRPSLHGTPPERSLPVNSEFVTTAKRVRFAN